MLRRANLLSGPPAREWRAKCPKETEETINEAFESRYFLVHEAGPLKFTLKGSDENTFHVTLGSLHQCSCLLVCDPLTAKSTVVKTEHRLCPHIIWSLNKRFKIARDSPLLYQTGLVEHELALLESKAVVGPKSTLIGKAKSKSKTAAGLIKAKEITADDVCPICQEVFTESASPTIHCARSCGNNVHVSCMKLAAEHQIRAMGQEVINCPLCRATFATPDEVETWGKSHEVAKRAAARQDASRNARPPRPRRHPGILCAGSSCGPAREIHGRRFLCVECPSVSLCQMCFDAGSHSAHPFRYKDSPETPFWTPATRYIEPSLPGNTIADLEGRDIASADYATLLALDAPKVRQGWPIVHAVATMPLIKIPVGMKLPPGQNEPCNASCTVCLTDLEEDQIVRRLPCGHARFHQDCVDRWLLQQSQTCPECSTIVLELVDQTKMLYAPTAHELDDNVHACPWTRRVHQLLLKAQQRKKKPKKKATAEPAPQKKKLHRGPTLSATPALPPIFASLLVVSPAASSVRLPSSPSPLANQARLSCSPAQATATNKRDAAILPRSAPPVLGIGDLKLSSTLRSRHESIPPPTVPDLELSGTSWNGL
ncbi:hypothetical protein BC828DRAFT_376243 [Blastocladiella britannica]|nr:hypothetical protein BC828DRAFT_376243 [Blastocladiella britannica]